MGTFAISHLVTDFSLFDDLSAADKAFIESVDKFIAHAANEKDAEEAKLTDKTLDKAYKLFYAYSLEWAASEKKKHIKGKDHPNAAKLKTKAGNVVNNLQISTVRFAFLYKRLSRCMAEITRSFREADRNRETKQGAWTGDSVDVLKKYILERDQLEKKIEELESAHQLLEGNASTVEKFKKNLNEMFAKDTIEKIMTSYNAGLRVSDFTKVERVIKGLDKEKTKLGFGIKDGKKKLDEIKKLGLSYMKIF